jgi:DNA-binding transcriptional MerR regulator
VSKKALRYYERLGVLTPVRGENGYREYREADIRVVQVVRSLGRLGIPVEQARPFWTVSAPATSSPTIASLRWPRTGRRSPS